MNGREVIPLFAEDRERYLEYDLTSMVYKLTRDKKPKIGVVTNLPLDTGLGGMQAALQGRSQPFVLYEQLQSSFDIQFLEQDFDRVPTDIDVVMIAHPKPLSPKTQYALDQFIMRGGRALVLLDPVSEIARQEMDPSGGPSQAATLSSAASIEPLMKSWGVAIDARFVIGDGQRALAVNNRLRRQRLFAVAEPQARRLQPERSDHRQFRDHQSGLGLAPSPSSTAPTASPRPKSRR